MLASHHLLVQPFKGLRCKGGHEHADLTGGKSQPLELWTWELATLVVDGICLLKRHLQRTGELALLGAAPAAPREELFPSVATGPGDPPVEEPPPVEGE